MLVNVLLCKLKVIFNMCNLYYNNYNCLEIYFFDDMIELKMYF